MRLWYWRRSCSARRTMDSERRKLCQAGGILLVGAALPACGGPPPGSSPDMGATCPAGALDTGIVASTISPNTAHALITVQKAVFVCRDANGLYAMDANCTHKGYFVNFNTA